MNEHEADPKEPDDAEPSLTQELIERTAENRDPSRDNNPWTQLVVPREMIYEPASKVLDDIDEAMRRYEERIRRADS